MQHGTSTALILTTLLCSPLRHQDMGSSLGLASDDFLGQAQVPLTPIIRGATSTAESVVNIILGDYVIDIPVKNVSDKDEKGQGDIALGFQVPPSTESFAGHASYFIKCATATPWLVLCAVANIVLSFWACSELHGQ